MKRVVTLAFVSALCCFASMEASAQFRFGFGYSMNTAISHIGQSREVAKYHGFHIGGTYDIGLFYSDYGMLALQPGLSYEYVIGPEKEYFKNFGTNLSFGTVEHYLHVPVMVKYGYDFIGGILGGYIFAGPTFSFGLDSQDKWSLEMTSGNTVTTHTAVTHNYTGKIDADGVPDNIRKILEARGSDYGWFDVKLGLGVGIDIMDVVDLKVGYDWGLMNRYTGEDSDNISKRTNRLYVTLAYIF